LTCTIANASSNVAETLEGFDLTSILESLASPGNELIVKRAFLHFLGYRDKSNSGFTTIPWILIGAPDDTFTSPTESTSQEPLSALRAANDNDFEAFRLGTFHAKLTGSGAIWIAGAKVDITQWLSAIARETIHSAKVETNPNAYIAFTTYQLDDGNNTWINIALEFEYMIVPRSTRMLRGK
jgi:hypothetical protein